MNYAQNKSGPRCHECTLREAPGPVPGEGSREHAALVYIAQNPGGHEVAATPMRPLVCPAGNTFNYQLAKTGIRRDELYISNQVKCLTPGNRPPTDHEIACCRPIINSELASCRADTVLLAGDVAFKANIGTYSTYSKNYHPKVGLMTRMGCVEQRDGRKYIGTIHPAFIMRMPDYKEQAHDHLRKAYSISGVSIPLPVVHEHPTQEIIDAHRSEALRTRQFADDVESVELSDGTWHMDICGFSAIRYEAFVLDRQELSLWGDIWDDPEMIVFEQNGVYESNHIPQVARVRCRKFDTMHALHYLRSYHATGDADDAYSVTKRSGLGLALKPFVTSLFTNLPYYGRDIEAATSRRFYCGLDNIATLLAGREQWRQLKEWGLEEVFFSLGMKIPYILDEWRKIGVNVDLRRALTYKQFIEGRIAKADLLLSKVIGPLINPNSPQQLKKLLYEDWGLPTQYNETRRGREVTKTVTTDNEARKRLRKWIAAGGEAREADFARARIFLDLQDYAEGEKTKSTFLDRIDDDGRIHPYFKAHGTSSFRLSSSPNLQNWPVYDVSQWGGARRDVVSEGVAVPTGEELTEMGSLRSIVIADTPEDVLLTIDFEQIELWAYAQQTQCRWLLDIYEKGEYIYGTVYERFYKLPFFQSDKPRKKRFKLDSVSEKFLRRAKAIPLGFLYGRSAGAVAEEHGWTLAEAEGYRREWFRLCPELEQSYARDRFTMEQKGWIRYPFGHVIHYPSRKPSDVYAMRGQNPAAGMLLTSIVEITENFRCAQWERVRIVLSVHDSLTVNIPKRLVEEVYTSALAPVLSRSVPELGGFVFRHSCEVGYRWDWETQDYHEWLAEYKGEHAA